MSRLEDCSRNLKTREPDTKVQPPNWRRKMKALFDEFIRFHQDNPEIYDLYVKYAFQLRDAGRENYGSKAIVERIRWHVNVETQSKDEFKINNNHTAYYARMVMMDYPELKGYFRIRSARNDIELKYWMSVPKGTSPMAAT